MHTWKERACGAARCPSALADEPERVCEVVEREHRLHALLAKLAEHVAVMPDLTRIELTLSWLDAGPLDREAVGALAHLSHERRFPPAAGVMRAPALWCVA